MREIARMNDQSLGDALNFHLHAKGIGTAPGSVGARLIP
jgi:hypothetical protein